jgi:hypothetical protein
VGFRRANASFDQQGRMSHDCVGVSGASQQCNDVSHPGIKNQVRLAVPAPNFMTSKYRCQVSDLAGRKFL